MAIWEVIVGGVVGGVTGWGTAWIKARGQVDAVRAEFEGKLQQAELEFQRKLQEALLEREWKREDETKAKETASQKAAAARRTSLQAAALNLVLALEHPDDMGVNVAQAQEAVTAAVTSFGPGDELADLAQLLGEASREGIVEKALEKAEAVLQRL